MGQSIYERLLKFAFENENDEHKKNIVRWVEILQLIIHNLFIATPVESAQDVTEFQFGFMVDTIAGISLEEMKNSSEQITDENNSDRDVSMEEEPKENAQKENEDVKQEVDENVKQEVDENESKVLEQIMNKK